MKNVQNYHVQIIQWKGNGKDNYSRARSKARQRKGRNHKMSHSVACMVEGRTSTKRTFHVGSFCVRGVDFFIHIVEFSILSIKFCDKAFVGIYLIKVRNFL